MELAGARILLLTDDAIITPNYYGLLALSVRFHFLSALVLARPFAVLAAVPEAPVRLCTTPARFLGDGHQIRLMKTLVPLSLTRRG